MIAPVVSVVVPAHNALPFIFEAVSSVERQSLGTDRLELIVIDDGSTDGTGDELERLAASRPWMSVGRLPGSGGPAAPRNAGLDRARGDYVFFLDADDYLGDEALERMVAYARENDSDIVQGRLVGLGGRRVYSLGEHNHPNIDALSSGIYWLLNPIKLFRRSFIEGLGLRFPEDLRYGEDQPFVATALLSARVISVVNDYECVYWVLRDDESNLTLRRHPLDDYRKVVEVMFPLVQALVPPGSGRDNLLRRHFEFGVMHVMRAIAEESDPDLREAELDRVLGWLDELCSDEIERKMPPIARVTFALLRAGHRVEALDVARLFPNNGHVGALTENDRTYVRLPYFRDPSLALSDELYDITSRLRVVQHLDSVRLSGGLLRLEGAARIDHLDTAGARVAVLVRRHGGKTVYRCDAVVTDGAYGVELDLNTIAEGRPLPAGEWRLLVEVAAAGAVRNAPLGSHRDSGACPDRLGSALGRPHPSRIALLDRAEPLGSLRITAGVERGYVFRVVSARWTDSRAAELEIACELPDWGIEPGPARVTLTGAGHTVERVADVAANDGRVAFVRASVNRGPDGSFLPDGTWSLLATVAFDGLELSARVPVPAEPSRLSWRRRVMPVVAKPTTKGRLRVIGFWPRIRDGVRRRLPMRRRGSGSPPGA